MVRAGLGVERGRRREDVLVGEASTAFVGRAEELDGLRRILAEARAGQPRTVLLTGPAGIGKTALVERFVGGLADARVLRASGEQWEALVAFGVADQLLRTAGVRADVLSAAAGVPPGEQPADVGALLLATVEDLAGQHTLVLLIDDVQWADVDSLRALLFTLRRLVDAPVLTLLVARAEDAPALPESLRRLAGGTTGRSIAVEALDSGSVQRLAAALGVPQFSPRTAERLREHTGGNPLYVRALLTELPADRWRSWEPTLPAPSSFAAGVVSRLAGCGAAARALVEACAVLGVRCSLPAAATLAGLDDPMPALDEAVAAGLLRVIDPVEVREVAFGHPLVQAAVYEHVPPAARTRLHRTAAGVLDDAGAALRHRVTAAIGPDPELAESLDAFAHHRMSWGAWASAASALLEASRLSADRGQREQRLLRAIDAVVSAGDLPQASAFARDVGAFAPGPLRDAALGYLAVLRGRVAEAEALLTAGWERPESVADPHLGALLALRWTLHSIGRLRGAAAVGWSERAMALAPDEEAVRLEAGALRGLSLGLAGRVPDGLAAYASELASATGDIGSIAGRFAMAQSWLRVVVDDLEEVPATLAAVAPAQLRSGSVRIAVWSSVWLARARFLLGDWPAALAAAERAVTLLDETGHEWVRPLVRWVATAVSAARGDWADAERHAARAAAEPTDSELMIVTGGLAAAELAWVRGDAAAVLTALAPVRDIPPPRQSIDEPGFWPWQHLYADALVGTGRLAEAADFLLPHEELAAARGRRSSVARLARVRGRLEAARGRPDAAEAAFALALDQLDGLPLPFEQALGELAHGQLLRRRGRRRAASGRLVAARERFAELGAAPFVERCDVELAGSGLTPGKRGDHDPARLTRQEQAVATRVATGMSNREIASDMTISVKTVQFHVGNIYSKLGVRSRLQLANRLQARAGSANDDRGVSGGS